MGKKIFYNVYKERNEASNKKKDPIIKTLKIRKSHSVTRNDKYSQQENNQLIAGKRVAFEMYPKGEINMNGNYVSGFFSNSRFKDKGENILVLKETNNDYDVYYDLHKKRPNFKKVSGYVAIGRNTYVRYCTSNKVLLFILILMLAIALLVASLNMKDYIDSNDNTPSPKVDVADKNNPNREYEDNQTLSPSKTNNNQRVNISFKDEYVISDASPEFQIGYADQNAFDITLDFIDSTGKSLYKTKYIAPGTNIIVNGTNFCKKGTNEINLRVNVYNHATGELVNNGITFKMSIKYN